MQVVNDDLIIPKAEIEDAYQIMINRKAEERDVVVLIDAIISLIKNTIHKIKVEEITKTGIITNAKTREVDRSKLESMKTESLIKFYKMLKSFN